MTTKALGYIFLHEGKGFTPDGAAGPMTRAEVDAHNAALAQAEVAWFREHGPARGVAYLHRDSAGRASLRVWAGDILSDRVSASPGRRWNPFGARWDTVIRGHAHIRLTSGALACYTFSGDYGMATRLRRVGPCRVARTSGPAPLLTGGAA